MKRVNDHIRQGIFDRAGICEPRTFRGLEMLRKTEWSREFERLMRARLVMGALRYGILNAPEKPEYDRMQAISLHVTAYQRDGNMEHLVDIANLSLCEFEEGTHPKRHFAPIDDGPHAARAE